MLNLEKPVFIYCLHRSGSTYVKNILDSAEELKMLEDEVHFDHPFFLNTFRKYYGKYCNDYPQNYDKFLTAISENKIRGAFWDYYKNDYGNFLASKKCLTNLERLSVWDSFNSILRQVLKDSGKKRIGIKYPAHHTFFRMFRERFPGAKNIFLVRDPRAVIASKVVSPTNYRLKNKGKIKYETMRLMIILYFMIEFRSFAKIVSSNRDNIDIIKYENLVMDPDKSIRDLCAFAEVELKPEMFSVNGKDSGYVRSKTPFIRLDRWKTVLRKYEIIIIQYFTKKSRFLLSYESK